MAHPTIGSLALLPKGAYLGTGKHYSDVSVLKNSSIVATCHVDVNMLSCNYGQTYDQTHNGSLRAARQASHRDDQGALWLSFRCGSDTSGDQDGGTARGTPRCPSPKQGTALLSRHIECEGFTRRFDKNVNVWAELAPLHSSPSSFI